MGRERRPYLPGGIFHLTARTIRGERWLTPELRTAALHTLADVLPASRMRILAAAIMSNHLHLVVQQGEADLFSLMQPLLRRLAGRIQATHGFNGPVFWRPYTSTHCAGPRHARNAVLYTHLNPVRAGICDNLADYPWTTHALYAGLSTPPPIRPLSGLLDPLPFLALFATGPLLAAEHLVAAYHELLRQRLQHDDTDPPPESLEPPPHAVAAWPDMAWNRLVDRNRPHRGSADPQPAPRQPGIARLAQWTLDAEAPGTTLDAVRGRGGGRRASQLRHLVMRRLRSAGHRNVDIARLLGVSESAVSYAVCNGWQTST